MPFQSGLDPPGTQGQVGAEAGCGAEGGLSCSGCQGCSHKGVWGSPHCCNQAQGRDEGWGVQLPALGLGGLLDGSGLAGVALELEPRKSGQ